MRILSKTGNEELIKRVKTVFICSRKTPDNLEYLVGKWLLGLSAESDCVMCGNQSPMERAVFTTLLQRKIPAILMLAEAMPDSWDDDITVALNEGRLLIMTHCDASVHRVTARSAFDRNVLMLSMAQHIVVGCCTKGGRLERALAGFDNVEYLDNGQPWLGNADAIKPKPEPEPVVQYGGNFPSDMLKLRSGVLFLDFNDSGAETYFKISCSVSSADGKDEQQKMFFDYNELVSLFYALGHIADTIASDKGFPQGIMVKSLSGDVTFAEVQDGEYRQIVMTQEKDLGKKGYRRSRINVGTDELQPFADKIKTAIETWKKQRK